MMVMGVLAMLMAMLMTVVVMALTTALVRRLSVVEVLVLLLLMRGAATARGRALSLRSLIPPRLVRRRWLNGAEDVAAGPDAGQLLVLLLLSVWRGRRVLPADRLGTLRRFAML